MYKRRKKMKRKEKGGLAMKYGCSACLKAISVPLIAQRIGGTNICVLQITDTYA